MSRRLFLLVLLLSGVAAPASAGYDECDAGFIAFIGADAYQFSPAHPDELGRVRLFSVLSYEGTVAAEDFGRAFWRLELRAPGGEVVRVAHGQARIAAAGRPLAEFLWDGRDQQGNLVPAGTYDYTFLARFLPDRVRPDRERLRYGDLGGLREVTEAYASTDQVVVRYDLAPEEARLWRVTAAVGTCEAHQNAPIEVGFGYNFYYGSTHSHSNWSDGGQPTGACSSGNAYGSGTLDPAGVFDYARFNAGVDYWVINEHNHLIQDALATNNPPVTEAKVRQRYAAGLAAAAAATVDDVFVALYGMEWGVTTNSDQGHVTLLETPLLFGWETCSTCNGPNPECTPGTNCYFDVFTPKRFGYLTLYQRSVENPSPAGALGILCHPGASNFDGYAFDANADAALQGIAVRSGLAFNTATNCADANVASTDYTPRWKDALNRGFHLGPVADHDAHCNTYGQGIPNRTVYLLPNGGPAVLTRNALLQAHKARRFYASEDSNAQLVFATGDGAHLMGEVFGAQGSATLRAAVFDPAGEAVSTLEIWRGQIGGGIPASPYLTVSGQSSLTLTENLSSGEYYYYVHAVQADGHDLWSSPMWISYSPGGCSDTTAPAVSIVSPPAGSTISCVDTTVQVAASDASGVQSVEVQIDGGAWNAAAFNAASGYWEHIWASGTASSGAHAVAARATDASCNANVGSAVPSSVTVDNSNCGTDVSGWRLEQVSATFNFILPAGARIPRGGYLIVGRDATKAAFEAFWRAGAPLPGNAVYVNSAGAMPIINGDEMYTLYNAAGTKIDGRTVKMPAGGGKTLQRKDPCLQPGKATSWTTSADTAATAGSGAGPGCNKGVVINEFSDASGTGNFVYEFVELHDDN